MNKKYDELREQWLRELKKVEQHEKQPGFWKTMKDSFHKNNTEDIDYEEVKPLELPPPTT